MTDNSFKIVGFDLDGTLVDTAWDLAAAVNAALENAGRSALPREQIRPMIGGGGRHMLAQALALSGGASEDELLRLEAVMLGFYDAHIAVNSRPFPGAMAAVDALRAQGMRVGIATNKGEVRARKLLDALGITHRFECVIGGDTLGSGTAKPAPAMIHELIRRCGGGACAFVGDTRYDILAAKAAGVAGIAVSFGFRAEPVATLGADAVIDSFDALVPTLERLSARSWACAAVAPLGPQMPG